MIWFLLLAAGAATVTVATFWDEIRTWWMKIIDPLLEKFGLTSVRKAFVEFDRVVVRARRIVKRAIAYFQVSKEKAIKQTTEEEINLSDVPTDIQSHLMKGNKVLCTMKI